MGGVKNPTLKILKDDVSLPCTCSVPFICNSGQVPVPEKMEPSLLLASLRSQRICCSDWLLSHMWVATYGSV